MATHKEQRMGNAIQLKWLQVIDMKGPGGIESCSYLPSGPKAGPALHNMFHF